MISRNLRHQACSSEWGCTSKYTPIQPNFDLAPHLTASDNKFISLGSVAIAYCLAQLGTPENGWERLCFLAVSLSRGLAVL